MEAAELNKLLSRDPYDPVRLHLANGESIDILNPGLAMIHRLVLYVFRTDRPDTHIAEDYHLVSLPHIAHAEFTSHGSTAPRQPKP